jgi:hypothetical protein
MVGKKRVPSLKQSEKTLFVRRFWKFHQSVRMEKGVEGKKKRHGEKTMPLIQISMTRS